MNSATYLTDMSVKYMLVADSMQGKQINLICSTDYYTYSPPLTPASASITISFLNNDKQEISRIYKSLSFPTNSVVTVPINTRWILYTGISSSYQYGEKPYMLYPKLYDIYPVNW
ncbi:hypothetical protein D3C71_1521310 [compost metagenome]